MIKNVRIPLKLNQSSRLWEITIFPRMAGKGSPVSGALAEEHCAKQLKDEPHITFSYPALRQLGIIPADSGGLPLPDGLIKDLTPLWVQTMHARAMHPSPERLSLLLHHYTGVRLSASLIRKYTATCKPCAVIKVTYKNPPRQEKKKPYKKILVDLAESSSSESEADDALPQRDAKSFNHRIYQDCASFPPSIGSSNQACSVIVDHFTSVVSVRPIRSPNAEQTAQHLLTWIDAMGTPFSVQTDNGPEFSEEYSAACRVNHILHRSGIVARPQQQGKVERAIRELKKLLVFFLRQHHLPDEAWEWGAHAAAYALNRVPSVKNKVPPLSHIREASDVCKHWPGDRVAFKPRGTALLKEDPSNIKKVLVGYFCGLTSTGKRLVHFVTNDAYHGVLVDKTELHFLPYTVTDCVALVRKSFTEPWNVDLATRLAMKDPATTSSIPIEDLFKDFKEEEVAHGFSAQIETSGKSHLEVSEEDLKNGSHDEAIVKEFESFIRNQVFGKEVTREDAKKNGYEIVTFRGVATWKLKDGVRQPKWRGVCRGFQDKWVGEVDTDAPTQAVIKLCFLVGISRGLFASLSDARTAFLQVPCPTDRKVAVQISLNRVPPNLPSSIRPGGIYTLNRMLYGLKDSPRRWVIFLREKLESLGWKHVGSGVFIKDEAITVAYYDD